MIKIVKRLVIVFLSAFIFTLFTNVYAGTAYVKDMNIKATVNEDGSMDVIETILFNVEDSLNGFYRDIKIAGNGNTKAATGLKINQVLVDGNTFKYSYDTLYNGDSGKYNINENINGKQVKVFSPTSNETKQVEIHYTLYDVVTVYNDIAELYWNFIGDEWDYGMDNVNIEIKLPKDAGKAGEDLRVWSHGPLNGNSKIVDSKTVSASIQNLKKNTFFDVRVTFPKDVVPYGTNTEYINKLDDILKEEEILAAEANSKRFFSKLIIYAIAIISAVIFIYPIVAYIKWKKHCYKVQFDGQYYRELPEDYGPAVMNACIAKNVLPKDKSLNLKATLLDLVRRGYVRIEEYTIEKVFKDKKDYKLTLIKDDLSELNEQEKVFVEKLIFIAGKEMTLDILSKLNTKSTTAQNAAYKAYQNWEDKIEKVAIDKEIMIARGKRKRPNWVILPFVYAILLIIAAFIIKYPVAMPFAFIFILEFAIISRLVDNYHRMTEKGLEHNAMWKAFKEFLSDFSNMQDYDEKSLVVWEHYLVYATGLGIAEKVIKNMKVKFPDLFEENRMLDNMIVLSMCTNMNSFNSFDSAFNSFASSAFSSPSSGSGGGGGSSGGGGGGRRRRRRRRLLK